jgi:hypothetical protein
MHAESPSKKTSTPSKGQPAKVSVSPSRDFVTLSKGIHRWTFSCERGQEQNLLIRLAELARNEDVPFDWFDAALVSHQLRNRLLPGLYRNESPAGAATVEASPKPG